jgi:hypothetical protein
MVGTNTVQSPVHRGLKATAIFAVALFLFGGSAGLVAAADEAEASQLNLHESGFMVPSHSVGEIAAFDLELTGSWGALPLNQSYLESFAVIEILGVDEIRYTDGHVQNALQSVQARWQQTLDFDFNNPEKGLFHVWKWYEFPYMVDPVTGKEVALVGNASGSATSSAGPIGGTTNAESALISYRDESQVGDCLHASPPTVQPGMVDDWQWQGCSLNDILPWFEGQHGAEIIDPVAADGRFHIRMDNGANETIDVWYVEGIARPVEIQISSAGLPEPWGSEEPFGATIRLVNYLPGDDNPVDISWLEPALPPIRETSWTEAWPDDSDLDHPFPVSVAMTKALEDLTYDDVRQFMGENPGAYLSGLSYDREENDDGIDRQWRITLWGEGTNEMVFWATMSTPPNQDEAGALDGESNQLSTYKFTTASPAGAPSHDGEPKPETFRSFGDLVNWLDAFSGDLQEKEIEPGFWWRKDCFQGSCNDFMRISRDTWDQSTVPSSIPADPTSPELGSFYLQASTLIMRDWVPQAAYSYSGDYAWGVAALKQQPPTSPEEAKPWSGTDSTRADAFAWTPPTTAVAGASIGIAILSGLAYFFWPILKQGVFFGLFSRLKQPTLLDHPGRSSIHDAVEAEPGIRFSALAAQTNMANGTLRHHLDILCNSGVMLRRENGGVTCYFAPKDATPEAVALASTVQSDGARTILDYIKGNPQCTARIIAEATGLAVGTVGYHVKKLRDAGVIDSARDGRKVRLMAA